MEKNINATNNFNLMEQSNQPFQNALFDGHQPTSSNQYAGSNRIDQYDFADVDQKKIKGSRKKILSKAKINFRSNAIKKLTSFNPKIEEYLKDKNSGVPKEKFSVLDKLHFVLMNKVNDCTPIIDDNGDNHMVDRFILYNEYKNMFHEKDIDLIEVNEIKHHKLLTKFIDFERINMNEYTEDAKCNRQRIVALQQERVRLGERNFLNVIEKNEFEKLNQWKPKFWYTKLLWYLI